MFSVNEWGSHPSEDNDDCWTGEDFETLDEAVKAFENYAYSSYTSGGKDTAWLILRDEETGEILRGKQNPDFAPSKADDDREWRSEFAMQNGMAFGCAGYNDAMGY